MSVSVSGPHGVAMLPATRSTVGLEYGTLLCAKTLAQSASTSVLALATTSGSVSCWAPTLAARPASSARIASTVAQVRMRRRMANSLPCERGWTATAIDAFMTLLLSTILECSHCGGERPAPVRPAYERRGINDRRLTSRSADDSGRRLPTREAESAAPGTARGPWCTARQGPRLVGGENRTERCWGRRP